MKEIANFLYKKEVLSTIGGMLFSAMCWYFYTITATIFILSDSNAQYQQEIRALKDQQDKMQEQINSRFKTNETRFSEKVKVIFDRAEEANKRVDQFLYLKLLEKIEEEKKTK